MDEFSIEAKFQNISNSKTRKYMKEVVSSYQHENYRSAIVMLWSVSICDLLYKMKYMVDMYQDSVAQDILNEIKGLWRRNEKSSDWEIKLVDLVRKKTDLLNVSEHQNLIHLQAQRHLSAHPVLADDFELHRPNRETVRAFIRNTLEGLLTKSPVLTSRVFTAFIKDLAEVKDEITNVNSMRRYLESKYLSKMTMETKGRLFRSLWKLVFRLDDDDCKENRIVNYWAVCVLFDSKPDFFEALIKDEADYYSDISTLSATSGFLFHFLSKRSEIYVLLKTSARELMKSHYRKSVTCRCLGWFLAGSIQKHYDDILEWIAEDKACDLKEIHIKYLRGLSDSEEWGHLCREILNTYYSKSADYYEADERFLMAIRDYIEEYDKHDLEDLLEKATGNSQTYGRRAAKHDHDLVLRRCKEVFGEDFDESKYASFFDA